MRKESLSTVQIFYPKYDKEELLQKLKKKIKELSGKIPLSFIVLFGSYAQGNYTVASDIDLLVVYRGKEREDAFATVKKILDIPSLEPHIYSGDEYKRLKPVISRMIANGIVLFPINKAKII